MADEFNKFFAEAGKKIYNSVDPVNKSPLDYVPNKIMLIKMKMYSLDRRN